MSWPICLLSSSRLRALEGGREDGREGGREGGRNQGRDQRHVGGEETIITFNTPHLALHVYTIVWHVVAQSSPLLMDWSRQEEAVVLCVQGDCSSACAGHMGAAHSASQAVSSHKSGSAHVHQQPQKWQCTCTPAATEVRVYN